MLQNFFRQKRKKNVVLLNLVENFRKNVQFLDQNQLAFLTKINLPHSLAFRWQMP